MFSSPLGRAGWPIRRDEKLLSKAPHAVGSAGLSHRTVPVSPKLITMGGETLPGRAGQSSGALFASMGLVGLFVV